MPISFSPVLLILVIKVPRSELSKALETSTKGKR
jgi:hypothetical protein